MPQKLTDAERTRRAVEHARISSEDHARALAEDSGLVPYEAHEQARQAARARISAAVVRPVKGRARPREEALREYDQEMGRRRDRITERYGPTSSVLWQFWAPDADDESPVRWRLELECGHVTEALTNSESQLPLGPWPTNSGDALIEGECFCPDRECSWRQPGARYYDRTWPEQDVAVWGARAPDFFLKPDPVEPPDCVAGLKPDLLGAGLARAVSCITCKGPCRFDGTPGLAARPDVLFR